MTQLFTNAARGELSASILSTDTSLSIVTGGAAYPVANTGTAAIGAGADWFKAVLQDATHFEIIYVRTHTSGSNTFSNVLRGQEGTTAFGFGAAAIFGLRITSQDIQALISHVGSGDTAHAAVVAAGTAGFMTGTDKSKLDGIAAGATNYTHPANHPPSIITQDASNRFVTDAQITSWTAKGDVTLTGVQTLTNKTLTAPTLTTPLLTGANESKVAMGANDVSLSSGNYFSKTISGATTLTVSSVPSSGIATSFILDLTNGGSAAITWWSGMKWAGGTAPTLTAAGRDVLGFFTYDGGTTWTGLLLGKDVK